MEPEHHVAFGPFHLDGPQGGLWQGAQAIALRPQSLALLRYLVAHSGRPGLRWAWAQCGRVDSISLGRARQSSRAGERVPETEENLQRRVLTQSGAALAVTIQAASVHTGSGRKDSTLKRAEFFNVDEDPVITFHSTALVPTGPETFAVPGTFTRRGVSQPETLHLPLTGKGTGAGEIRGTMAFDRKDDGMTSGIPFLRIADRVEVRVNLKGTRVSGPPVVFKQ
jgi:YceI-like domain